METIQGTIERVGEKRAVNKSIRTISAQVRNTHLRKRIMDRFIKSDAV